MKKKAMASDSEILETLARDMREAEAGKRREARKRLLMVAREFTAGCIAHKMAVRRIVAIQVDMRLANGVGILDLVDETLRALASVEVGEGSAP